MSFVVQCSVRCGRDGLQQRRVVCRDWQGQASARCDAAEKPLSSQACVGVGYRQADCKEGDEDSDETARAKRKGSTDNNGGWRRLEVEDTPATAPTDWPPAAAPMPPQMLTLSKAATVTNEARSVA
jgi:hypothetical protein